MKAKTKGGREILVTRVNFDKTPKTAKQIVDSLTEEMARAYLTNTLLIMYGSLANSPINPEKEWSPDTLQDLGSLLGTLVN